MNNKFIGIVLLSAFMFTAASCRKATSGPSDKKEVDTAADYRNKGSQQSNGKKAEEAFIFMKANLAWLECIEHSDDTSYYLIDTVFAYIDKGFEAGYDTLRLKTLRVNAYDYLKQDYATALRYLDQDFPAGAPALMGPVFRDATSCRINARICKQKGDRANEMNYYRQGYEITKNYLKENRRKFEEFLKLDNSKQILDKDDMGFSVEQYLLFHAALDPQGFYDEIDIINTMALNNNIWTDMIIQEAEANYICNDVDSRQQKSNGQNAK